MTHNNEQFEAFPADSDQLDRQLEKRYERFTDDARHQHLRTRLLGQLAKEAPPVVHSSARTYSLPRLVTKLVRAAAVILIAMGLSFLVGSLVRNGKIPQNQLFARVSENIREAELVSFNQSVELPDGRVRDCQVEFYSDGREIQRFDDSSIQYSDFAQGKFLYISADGKWGLELKSPPRHHSCNISQPWLLLRDIALSSDSLRVPLRGKTRDGYIFRLVGEDGQQIHIKAAKETFLPLEVIMQDEKLKVSLDDFDWQSTPENQQYLLGGDVQDKFQLAEKRYVVDMSFVSTAPDDSDVAEMMKILVRLNGGESPAKLSTEILEQLTSPLNMEASNLSDMPTSLSLLSASDNENSQTPAIVSSLRSLRELIYVKRGISRLNNLQRSGVKIKYYARVKADSNRAVLIYSLPEASRVRIYGNGSVDFEK